MFFQRLAVVFSFVSLVLCASRTISLTAKSSGAKGLRRAVTTGVGTDPLADYFNGTDLQWYGPVSIGTPGQNLTCVFDSGSTTLLIPGIDCTAELGCPSFQHKFNPATSSTFRTNNATFRAGFATGVGAEPSDFEEEDGIIVSDQVCVAGLCVANQTFGLTHNQTSGFAADPFDGILGLAFPSLSATGNASFFQSLIDADEVAQPLYGFYLTPEKVGGAELTLGGIDTTKLTSAVHYFPIDPPFWEGNFSQLSVNGHATNISSPAVFDTGTSNIVGPSAKVVEEVYALISPKIKLIDPAGAYGLPCNETKGIKSVIDFTLGGKKFTIPSKELSVGEYPGQPGICQTLINADVNGLTGGEWIVGASLLKYYYSVWDFGNTRLGLADTAISPPRH